MNRRTFLRQSAAAGAAFYLGGCAARASAEPLVETAYGKVRGAVNKGVFEFKGIPYGASTEGARRFLPPARPKPWTGEYAALEWGPEAPQVSPHTEIPEVRATIPAGLGMSEDCLRLNVWTSGLNDGGRRPVMVWLHGGGFSSGNGSYTIYNGANLARKRNVVQVTVNHRLNVFGFLHLADIGGERFAHATNAGILDVVAALEWVRDNIERFGGDPGNVTIYGQSGGAGKVSTLLAMPPAQGLFHKAIVQSGSALTAVPREAATEGAKALMAKLGAKTPEDLQQIPMADLTAAIQGMQQLRLAPVIDPATLPRDPFRPDASTLCANVPLLCGTTETEVTFFPNAEVDPIDDARLLERVKAATRADDAAARNLIRIYREGRPGVSNIDVALILESDVRFRPGVLAEAELKSAQAAPVYMYYFTWRSPVREGKLKSFHTLEIPFVNEDVDEAQSMTGAGQDRYALQDRMSLAWTQFARTGNPNHPGLPEWPRFTTTERATMIFDNECKVVNDPNGAERRALAALRG
jgi:para-nitrobenzyl esterase